MCLPYDVMQFNNRCCIHGQAMKKYDEAPFWWYVVLLVLAFFSGTLKEVTSGDRVVDE